MIRTTLAWFAAATITWIIYTWAKASRQRWLEHHRHGHENPYTWPPRR